MAEAGAGEGGERRVGGDEVADKVGEEGMGEGVLWAALGGVGEEVDGEGEIRGGEVGTEGLVGTGLLPLMISLLPTSTIRVIS